MSGELLRLDALHHRESSEAVDVDPLDEEDFHTIKTISSACQTDADRDLVFDSCELDQLKWNYSK